MLGASTSAHTQDLDKVDRALTLILLTADAICTKQPLYWQFDLGRADGESNGRSLRSCSRR